MPGFVAGRGIVRITGQEDNAAAREKGVQLLGQLDAVVIFKQNVQDGDIRPVAVALDGPGYTFFFLFYFYSQTPRYPA